MVVQHVGLEDWRVINSTASHGVLGTAAQDVLRHSGAALFPPASAGLGVRASYARGGTLVTGEHGDWVLGYKRMTVLRSLWRRRGRGGAALWREAAISLSPSMVRSRVAAGQLARLPWLRPATAERRRAYVAREQAAVPLRWDREVASLLGRRFLRLGSDTQRLVGQAYGADLLEPLAHPVFVRAYAGEGGVRGFESRTVGMRHLVGDLLPLAVVERSAKAYFARAHSGAVVAEFARGWDGSGVDDALVDPEELRTQWLSGTPHPLTLGLLQQAWLDSVGAAR
jgi:asparagine synthase (glutamine-hydrolysing)